MKKKKKGGFTVVYILLGLVVIYVVVSLTGIVRVFNIPTSSSKPTIEPGDRIVVSTLVKPDRFDMIVFKIFDSLEMRRTHYVFRLCGMPGDTVEIRNGDLYVNGQLPDKQFDLSLPYTVAFKDIATVTTLIKLGEEDLFARGDEDVLVYLSGKDCETLRKHNILFERKITPREEKNDYIARVYKKEWNEDHFGPLIIPADYYFVLGDNRHRAQDSRYTGLIPISDFHGTVILQ